MKSVFCDHKLVEQDFSPFFAKILPFLMIFLKLRLGTWKIKKEENSDETTILQFYFKKRKKSSTFYCRKRIFTCKSNLTSFFKVYFWPIFCQFLFWNRRNFSIFTIFFSKSSQFDDFFAIYFRLIFVYFAIFPK